MKLKITNCILISLSISHWDANSLDKLMSQTVATESGVKDKNMCRLRKSLLPKTDVMNRLSAIIRAARTFHYENTHAYVHEGPRILTRDNYEHYMFGMLGLQADFKTCVLDFCAQFEDIKLAAKDALGKLYAEADYPDASTLESRYGFTLTPIPMSSVDTLAEFGLGEQETANLKAQLEQSLHSTFTKANEKMWEDLYKRLEKLANKLNEEGAHVMDETIAGVKKLADLIPRINLVKDRHLELVAKHLSATLDGVTSLGVKVNPSLRLRVAQETAKSLAAMKALMDASQLAEPVESVMPAPALV